MPKIRLLLRDFVTSNLRSLRMQYRKISSILASQFIFACMMLFAASWHAPVSAMPSSGALSTQPQPSADITPYTDWLHICASEQCYLSMQQKDFIGTKPIDITISRNASGNTIIILRTPHDVHLPTGIELVIDGRAVGRLAFQTCDAHGCIAPAALSGELSQAFQRGVSLKASLTDRHGERSSSTISLMGLTAAIRALESQ